LATGKLPPDHGYRRTSIAEIARDAGIAVGTVYRYFAGKEAVFLAVVEQLNDAWLEESRRALEGPGTAVERMRRLGAIDEVLFAEMARRRAQGTAGRDDILSLLLEARDELGEGMTDRELRDQMFTLLMAGHETTATSLAWAFWHVLRHPDVLVRLREELADVAGGGPITEEHPPRLEYLDAVVKETQRLAPVVAFTGRILHEPTRIGGRMLPAGVGVTPAIYLTHRRADLWPEPERFRPERFLGVRPNSLHFFPFGGGVRRCLGAAFATMEMKVVLAEVVRRADLRVAPGYRMRPVQRAITSAPSGGMPVVLDAMR
jgi:cytochrome P450 family 110